VIGLSELRAAEAVVHRFFPATPVLSAPRLSKEIGAEVLMKMESCTPIRAFKIRGALTKTQALLDAGWTGGVVTASAGNHGLAVARAARLFDRSATVCVPESANPQKVSLIKAEGAHVVAHGVDYQAAYERCLQIGQDQGLAEIHAYDDPDVIAGQGTIGLELIDGGFEFDTVIMGVGGGGLISGIASAIKLLRPDTQVIGVQPSGADSMIQSVTSGHIQELDRVSTIADGLGARKPGAHTLRYTQRLVDQLVRVSDDEILHACRVLLHQERVVAEPAGAAGVAAMLKLGSAELSGRRIAVVISGANISDYIFNQILSNVSHLT